jgi:hypothetical protein
MKYGVKQEKELMTELWSGQIKDNPVSLPVGTEGHPPRRLQRPS